MIHNTGDKFSIAPMMNVTDRHCRAFLRLLSVRMKLYTEMKVSGAIIHGDRARFLDFDNSEHPLALQLAGSDPAQLAECARLAGEANYDEVNLNVGCPSVRVRDGQFGACLMATPELVARCVAEMRDALEGIPCAKNPIPVTVKTRIGIDQHDSYEYLAKFVSQVAAAGCQHFIIHARKAWLQGLSPKENRQVPALRYDRVYRLKRDFPDLRITINGSITTLQDALAHLHYVDGVMIGREARRHPWMLNAVDEVIFNDAPRAPSAIRTRATIVSAYLPYIECELTRGVHLRHMIQPILSLFHGQPGARSWRRYLTEHAVKNGAGVEVIQQALKLVLEMAVESIDVDVNDGRQYDDAMRGRPVVAQPAQALCSATLC